MTKTIGSSSGFKLSKEMGARWSLTENKLPTGYQQAKSCDLWYRLGRERKKERERQREREKVRD
jgi:hypothetical protein